MLVKMAEEVQAIAAKSIISGFRTVARPMAEAEATSVPNNSLVS